jgi:hypothetical protein
LGINYLNVGLVAADRLDWNWIDSLDTVDTAMHVVHAAAPKPFTIKIDGRQRLGVLLKPS